MYAWKESPSSKRYIALSFYLVSNDTGIPTYSMNSAYARCSNVTSSTLTSKIGNGVLSTVIVLQNRYWLVLSDFALGFFIADPGILRFLLPDCKETDVKAKSLQV